MNQNSPGNSNKKRNYISPQKTQTFIVAFTNQKAPQKKINNNTTPPRLVSALSRSKKAILGIRSPPTPNKNLATSNNPYEALSQEDDEDEVNTGDDALQMTQASSITKGDMGSDKSAERENASYMTPDRTDETASTSSTTISSQEKVLLSRKAQAALRKLRAAQKMLTDASIWAELELAYGVQDPSLLSDTMTNFSYQTTKDIASSAEDSSNVELQETEDMIIDELAEAASKENNGKEKDSSKSNLASLTSSLAPIAPESLGSTTEARPNPAGPTVNSYRTVSFAAALKPPVNSNSLRQGNPDIPAPTRIPPSNPYKSMVDNGIPFTQRNSKNPVRVDKIIQLKKNNLRQHIHRYTLRFKIIKPKSEDEGHQLIRDTLQRFLEIVLQAEPKTILPPYLELDRNDQSIQDLSSAFPISSLEGHHMVKKYFFRLSPRDKEGVCWCSIILAQPIPFSIFMDKAKYSLENNDFSLWIMASDNENSTDVGWLLYSTRAQDEERLTDMLSKLIGENIGVKWKAIKTSSNTRKKDQPSSEEKIRALHVECSVDRMQEVKDKLSVWYSSSSNRFPDGTKMRLVPTITSATSIENKTKFASCIARQAALNAGLASAITREIFTNLLLDRKDPATNKSFSITPMSINYC
jgi:hypothetical protein